MVKLFLGLIDNEFSQYLSRLQVQYVSIDLLVLLMAVSKSNDFDQLLRKCVINSLKKC